MAELLNGPWFPGIFGKRKMSAGTSLISEIGFQGPSQGGFIERNHMVQALLPDRPDQSGKSTGVQLSHRAPTIRFE